MTVENDSSSSSSAAPLSSIFAHDLALADFLPHFKNTADQLGPSGAVSSMPPFTSPLEYTHFVNCLGVINHPTKGLVLFQIKQFNSHLGVFTAASIENEPVSFTFAVNILKDVPFLSLARLAEIKARCPNASIGTGLSISPAPDGGWRGIIGTLDSHSYEFYIPAAISAISSTSGNSVPRQTHVDPTKAASIGTMPVAVSNVLFQGRTLRSEMFAANRTYTNFLRAMSMDLWLGISGETSYSLMPDNRIRICIPKHAAILFLNLTWIPLGHFRTENDIQKVMDSASVDPPQYEILRILSATEAIEAWANCGDTLNRLFFCSPEFKSAWNTAKEDISEIIRRHHEFAGIRTNGAIYDILDALGQSFFQWISRSNISQQQVQDALNHLRVNPTDSVFISLYEAARRRAREELSPPRLTGNKHALVDSVFSDEADTHSEYNPCRPRLNAEVSEAMLVDGKTSP